ncbi:MAG: helix-turn-helix domain-containing protein [Treponema sp.]|nr:helix-turn-helix domain-containing protein [Treponema sp.]
MNYSIGQNIKSYRKQLGLTQEELASQLFVTAQAVSKWESDSGMPDTAQIVPLAKALNISTDALFGLDNGNYDEAAAKKAHEIYLEGKNNLDKKNGPIQASEKLFAECEANPMNYEVYKSYVQSVAHLTRMHCSMEFSDEENALWKKHRDEAVRKSIQVIRYCKDTKIVEMTHYAIAWVYYLENNFDEAREHIAKLPSIESNMLQENFLPYLVYAEGGYSASKRLTTNTFQLFCLALNKQFVYSCERSFLGGNNPEETIGYCKWSLDVIKALAQKENMKPYCQGFVKDIYAWLIQSELLCGRVDEAAASFAELKKIIGEYVVHCTDELEKENLSELYDEKGIRNMAKYTQEEGQRRVDELLGKLKAWNGEDSKLYKDFCAKAGL